MLRFKAWAVYQCCSFWKLGSCVSPMLSRGACRDPSCSTSLAEWDRAGQGQSLLKGIHSSATLAPPTSDTIFRAGACHTSLLSHSAPVHVDSGGSSAQQHTMFSREFTSEVCLNVTFACTICNVGNYSIYAYSTAAITVILFA